ncbi:SDR family NAD(P)-dependent oxidoreductase [Cupriavidus necator]
MENDEHGGRAAWLGLAGRVCVVTGGGSGIGAASALELARCGALVAVLDRDGRAADAVADAIACAGGRAMSVQADVTSEDAIAAAAQRIQHELGSCRILVNSAALVGYAGPLMQADLAQWNRMLDVNLTGALLCIRAFAAQMISAGAGGSIVNVASICGHLPLPESGAYSVGKAGLLMLSRMLALELARHGIRCNSVSPGLVRTPATEAAYLDDAVAAGRSRLVPSGRIAEPKELASVIAFLGSEMAAYINGQDILADGGLSQALMSLVPKPATSTDAFTRK